MDTTNPIADRVTPRGRPRIAVTGPDRGGWPAWAFTRMAVMRSGGRPVRVTPDNGAAARPFDALVLGGGADVDLPWTEAHRARPRRAPQEVAEEVTSMKRPTALWMLPLVWLARTLFSVGGPPTPDPERDAMERDLIRRAMEGGRPILGICRGAQLLNVYFGGTLHRDLRGFYAETAPVRSVFPRKAVRLEPGSRLAGIVGGEDCRVNALNHQAVDKLGEGLRAVAREPNGLVQAIEREGPTLVVGVQWHPEFLVQIRRQRRLFEAVVREAGG